MLFALRIATAICVLIATSVAGFAFTIQEVKSPGGIKAWLVEEHAVPLIAMNFSFRNGSVYDPEGKEGVSEFLTGMMDEGAGPLSSAEFQSQSDDLAFRMSFDSGRDFFQGSFQTLSRNRDASFDLLRLAVTAPHFDPEPLERVRQQFLLNVRNKKDDPSSIASASWLKLAMPGDPYARESDGTEQSVAAITADDLHAAHQRIFTRDTLQVAVVGDIDAATLAPLLDKLFGGLPKSAAMTALPPAPQVKTGPMLKIIARDMPQSLIIFGHEGPLRSDPDFIPAYIMAEILGGDGFDTRLTTEIREKRGLTYGVGFDLSPLLRAGLYLGSLQTKNANAGEAMALVREVLAKMAADGPTAQELAEAKTYLTGSYALRFSSNAAIAGQLLGLQQQGLGADYVARRNGFIDAVTLDQVKAQAKRLLHPDRLTVTVVGKPEGLN